MSDQLSFFYVQQQTYTSDDYYTPKWVFESLNTEFDLDVASPPQGPPFTPCRRFYTLKDDGLASEWEGFVYMNPPYSKPAPWVDKFIEHGNGIALLPGGGGKWTKKLWNSEARALLLGRIAFYAPHNEKSIPGSQNIYLWGIGDRALQVLQKSNLGKVR